MSTGTRKWSDLAEGEKNLALALAFSAGLHLIVMLTLDLAPGGWRHGLRPALRVNLQAAPPEPQGFEPALQPAPAAKRVAPLEPPPAPIQRGRSADAAQSGGSLPIAERYYRSSEVDERAVPLEQKPLVLPENAYMWRLAGTVRARIYISEAGTVDSVTIIEARPHRGIFEEAAIEALRQVRYKPAEIAGRAVKSQKVIDVTFNPYEDTAKR